MLKDYISQCLFRQLVRTSYIFIFCVAVVSSLILIVGLFEAKKIELENDKKKVQTELSNTNRLIKQIKTAREVWNKIPDHVKNHRSELQTEDAKILIEELKKKRNIQTLNVNITNQATDSRMKNNKYIKILQSKLSIALSCEDDYDALGFLNELYQRFPGYLELESMSFMSNSDNIHTERPPFSATVEFKWRDIIDNEKANIGRKHK